MLDRYAVFGHPIGHSRSPDIHARFAAQTRQSMEYRAIDVPAERFETALKLFIEQGGRGLNCTVPLKELAFQAADQLSERARRSGAVNTLKILENGHLWGDNTDGVGLYRDLTTNLGLALQGKRILILGAGGATRGIIEPLLAADPQCLWIANRTLERAERLAENFKTLGQIFAVGFAQLQGSAFDLILNATSASLNGALPPLPEGLLAPGGSCYDLAYGKEPTPFVRWGQDQGASLSADGIGMLVEQAAEAFQIWRGIFPETLPVIEALAGGYRIR
ncbi:MAG: shikimate dehydrogenase [Pseudomonadota bacterium]